jgi:hypothetical protein
VDALKTLQFTQRDGQRRRIFADIGLHHLIARSLACVAYFNAGTGVGSHQDPAA